MLPPVFDVTPFYGNILLPLITDPDPDPRVFSSSTPVAKTRTNMFFPGLAIKNPPKKTPKNHLKKPTKMFFWGFWDFLNFKFFMKIIQTFLFETDF
jgi:hypothetical protein